MSPLVARSDSARHRTAQCPRARPDTAATNARCSSQRGVLMSVTGVRTTEGLVRSFAQARLGAGPEIPRSRACIAYHALFFLSADSAARDAREGREKVVKA